jgi:hypothetical protein
VINTRAGVASRLTDQSYYAGDNWDTFIATRTDVFGQTLVTASGFSTVKFVLVD